MMPIRQIEPADETEPNVFDQLDFSIAEICAFVFKHCGADALRELLDATRDNGVREWTEREADELLAMGLDQVAAIVAEHAATLPSRLDQCPYDPDTTNGRAWLDSERQRLRQRHRC